MIPEVFAEPGTLDPGRLGSPGNAASMTGSWSQAPEETRQARQHAWTKTDYELLTDEEAQQSVLLSSGVQDQW